MWSKTQIQKSRSIDYVTLRPRILMEQLQFPEGPAALDDGSVVFVEVASGSVRQVVADGSTRTVAHTAGGPNGLAYGPTGDLLLCNNGGLDWIEHQGLPHPNGSATDELVGSIQLLNMMSGECRTLYDHCGNRRLAAPNDLVSVRDGTPSSGGFWFTDFGKRRPTHRAHGGIYWAAFDGSRIIEAAYGLQAGPNGIGLSPDGRTLYVSETISARIWAWEIEGPGVLARKGRVIYTAPGERSFDGLALTEAGNIVIATLLAGELTVINPHGEVLGRVMLPDAMPTNICFGGPDMRTAYVTLAERGQLIALDWNEPGLRLAFQSKRKR